MIYYISYGSKLEKEEGGKNLKKKLLIIEGRHIKSYSLGKAAKPMTIVRQHLFRTDDYLFWSDYERPESILIYNLDDTQPYGTVETIDQRMQPDTTMAIIDVARTNHKKNVGVIGALSSMNPMTFIYIAIAVVIVLSALGAM